MNSFRVNHLDLCQLICTMHVPMNKNSFRLDIDFYTWHIAKAPTYFTLTAYTKCKIHVNGPMWQPSLKYEATFG